VPLVLRPRVLLVVGLGLSLAVAAYAVLAPSALPRLVDQRRDNDALERDLKSQHEQNAHRERELVLLKLDGPQGQAALEKAAREELGFVRKDEVLFVGLPTSASASAASPAPAAAAPAPGSP
jgi:cell division protein FtsB